MFQPQITMQPGQLEFWRVGNIGSNIFYQISLAGQPFHIIAQDGNLQNQVVTTDTLLLPPGKRLEMLVDGPNAGTYQLQAAAFNTGPAGDQYPGQLLGTVVASGSPVAQIPLPTTFPPVTDLSKGPIDKQRTIVFADTANPNQFTIDGKPFNKNCIESGAVATLQSASWRRGCETHAPAHHQCRR